MAAALGWGALAAAALLVGALVSYHLSPSTGVIAQVMALGAGLLIGSVSFELVDEALRTRTVAVWGYAVLDPAHGTTGALVQAFAAGALLAMLATTMLPEAYEREGLSCWGSRPHSRSPRSDKRCAGWLTVGGWGAMPPGVRARAFA